MGEEKLEKMKVIAINSSPNMGKGNTALVLDPFLEGMRKAGAEVELFYTKKLKINPCQGEINCWVKTPGKCLQQDDCRSGSVRRVPGNRHSYRGGRPVAIGELSCQLWTPVIKCDSR